MKDKKETTEEIKTEELKETTKKGPTKSEKLQAEIDALKAEIAEKDDKYLRMAAEYDNFRRRSREEKEGIWEAATAETVAELLPIIDNLDRAAQFEAGEKLREGLVMTAKATASVFEKLGVEEFGKPGDTFDPNLHNAVLHVDDDSYGEGKIIEVFQKGYKKGKRIIRFAMVKTAN
jgi:molecular chaperone GrpE